MSTSDYINAYIQQAKRERQKAKEPWLKNFFKEFSDELEKRSSNHAPGDKYIVTGSFAAAFNNLIPGNITITAEAGLKNYIDLPQKKELSDLLSRKRVDFAIDGRTATILIEFKTNVQFNDISAAMVEMWAAKKFAKKITDRKIITASLHLFPYKTNVDGLRLLNLELGNPLDHIWVLCTPELKFDTVAIKLFREEVGKIIS